MVNGKKAAKGQVVVDMAKAYETVKKHFMKQGATELRGAIYGTLFLEELARDINQEYVFQALTDIAMKALPDVERLQPSNPEEAEDKEAILAMYRKDTTHGKDGTPRNLCGLTGVTSKDPFTLQPGLPGGPLPPGQR